MNKEAEILEVVHFGLTKGYCDITSIPNAESMYLLLSIY